MVKWLREMQLMADELYGFRDEDGQLVIRAVIKWLRKSKRGQGFQGTRADRPNTSESSFSDFGYQYRSFEMACKLKVKVAICTIIV